ncbi:hypothetical protein DFJ73DRAFT_805409 [Zopfochytrium polystomum]|nr:hypothetical protein DFJ73DRAFT_805409 [Zopfochytrium polystomum]
MDSAFARILSSGLATEICHRLPDPRSRFLCATLCRLHTLQVDALCDLRPPAALLDRVSLRGLGVDDRLKAHFEMLQVFQQSLPPDQLDRLYTADTIDYSAFLCNSAVGYLEKWRASGIPMKYTAKAVDKAMERDDTYLLNWWINESGLELKFENGVDLATEFGSTSALEFWKNSGLPIEYTEAGIDNACKRVPRESLRWWKESTGCRSRTLKTHSIGRPRMAALKRCSGGRTAVWSFGATRQCS